MTPKELLTLFIDGLHQDPSRKARHLSAYESDWFRQSHELAQRPMPAG
jgi:hypothetical protein